MTNSMPDFDANEQELQDLLGEAVATCPSLPLLMACGQDVLPPEAEAQVQRHIAACRLCSQLIRDLSTLPEEELSPARSDRIAATLPALRSERTHHWWRYAGAIAAVVILAVGVLGLQARHRRLLAGSPTPDTKSQPSEGLLRETAALEPKLSPLAPPGPDVVGPLTRGGSETREPSISLLMPAFTAYNHGNYEVAVERFSTLQVRYPQSGIIPLYLGVSQLFVRKDADAYASLSKAVHTAMPSERDAASWYAAIAAERIGSPEARSLYAGLCATKQSPYSAESCRVAATLR